MPSPKRIFHTWEKWECYPAGFYEPGIDGLDDEQAKEAYRKFLADLPAFRAALERVIAEWKNSCEHYLTNEKMNRIAWLGQSSACVSLGLPSKYRSGYFLLTNEQQAAADALALEYLNRWLTERGYDAVTPEEAGVNAKVNIY